MATATRSRDRRTSVETIFDHLQEEIRTFRLRPGDKISEAEIADRFGVSRQPVRDAFSRLENIELLKIRPQRATEVKRFSLYEINKARFVRSAIETEVLRRAARHCNESHAAALEAGLALQRIASDNSDYAEFTTLDYQFHKLLCHIAGVDFAFDAISAEKAKVDRLCMLSLSKEQRMPQLVKDHEQIAKAVIAGDVEQAVDAGVLHLGRLDKTIALIVEARADYFEPIDEEPDAYPEDIQGKA